MKDLTLLDKIVVGCVEPHIYAFTTNTIPNYLKVGDTYRPVSIRLEEWKKHYPELEKKYDAKAMVSEDVFFRDYSIHQYLENDLKKDRLKPSNIDKGTYYSNEFFKEVTSIDLDNAIEDIKKNFDKNSMKYQFYDAKDNLKVITKYSSTGTWNLRPNQKEVVENFKIAYENGRTNLLLYAVMRFGKSFTSMCCALQMKAKIVLIVSAKADVKEEWKKTVQSADNFSEYDFIGTEELLRDNEIIKHKLEDNRRVVLFVTLQDLQGTKIKEKHKELFSNKIDLLLIDETHFGARAESYGAVLRDVKDNREDTGIDFNDADNLIKTLNSKVRIHLSGTPYRILMGSEFQKEDIIGFYQFSDIVKAQEDWDYEHVLDDNYKEWDNPYYGFPQMIRFAFNPNESSRKKMEELRKNGITYAFSELLRPISINKNSNNEHKKFKYENEILDLLQVIDGSKDDEEVLGFLNYDKIKNGKMCRHMVIVLPYCASCDALEELIINNKEKFKNLNEYEIINISGVDKTNIYKTVNDVKAKIKTEEAQNNKTITLTVNRMLTGSTVEEWDTMIYLKDTASPQEYDQAIFRLQNQYIKEYESETKDIIKYNKKPQTLLVDFDPNRMFVMQETKSLIYNVNIEKSGNSKLKERLENELRISPIIVINKDKIKQINAIDIMEHVSNYSNNRSVIDESNDIPVDFRLLNIEAIRDIILKQEQLGSKGGLKINNTDDDSDDMNFEELILDLDYENNETSSNTNNTESLNDNKDDIKKMIGNKFKTYYARILFYAFLSNNKINSLEDIIDSLTDENNLRISKNLDLNLQILELIYKNMNPFVLSQLDYKIQNINSLSNDQNLSEIERALVAIKKFNKLSLSEIITPQNICDEMLETIGIDNLINVFKNNGKVLDIASKQGEFALSLVNLLNKNGIHSYKDNIYSIPTSLVAYEFTRKIYEILHLNIDNISNKFTSYDLLNIKDDNDKLDYAKINKFLLQDKKFCDIELTENLFYKEGDDKMKFDVIVGNPPYQENVGNPDSNGALAKQLYPSFITIAIKLKPKFISYITPSRWFTGEGQDASFGPLRNFIKENNHMKKIVNYGDNKDVFKEENIGSVNYFLYDFNYTGDVDFVEIVNGIKTETTRPLFEEDMDEIIPLNILVDILNKVYRRKDFVSFKTITTGRNPFKVPETNESLKKQVVDKRNSKNKLCIRCANDTIKYTSEKIVGRNHDLVNKWKVFSSKMNGAAGTLMDSKKVAIIGKSFIGEPNSICSGALITFGCYDNEIEATNLKKYMETKFLRVMVGIMKSSRAIYQPVYKFVPLQDFTNNSDIDWSKPISDIDQQLYKKYNFSKEEIQYIEEKIKPIE